MPEASEAEIRTMLVHAVAREVIPTLREIGRAVGETGDASRYVAKVLSDFHAVLWLTMTPAQRRRHGKRIVREEIARRRMVACLTTRDA